MEDIELLDWYAMNYWPTLVLFYVLRFPSQAYEEKLK